MADYGPFNEVLVVRVDANEARLFRRSAEQQHETVSDLLRRRIGLLPETLVRLQQQREAER
jgi:hypothetical protein